MTLILGWKMRATGAQGAIDLDLLHLPEYFEEPAFVPVFVESRGLEGNQEFMCGLDGGETIVARLALDDEAATLPRLEAEPWKLEEGRAFAKDLPGTGPRRVNEEYDEPSISEKRFGESIGGQVLRSWPGIKEHGIVVGIVDEGSHSRVTIESEAWYDFAVRQVEAGQATCRAFFTPVFHRMH
jgi:hypothetical protein